MVKFINKYIDRLVMPILLQVNWLSDHILIFIFLLGKVIIAERKVELPKQH